jgi:hypothetical protein
MTEPSDGPLSAGNENASERLRAIAADLSAAGLSIHLHHTRAGLDLTATLHQPGHRETDVLVDEDGYTELRYWADPDATSAQIANTITGALAVVATNLAKRPQPRQGRYTDLALRRRPPHRTAASVTG